MKTLLFVRGTGGDMECESDQEDQFYLFVSPFLLPNLSPFSVQVACDPRGQRTSPSSRRLSAAASTLL